MEVESEAERENEWKNLLNFFKRNFVRQQWILDQILFVILLLGFVLFECLSNIKKSIFRIPAADHRALNK